MQWNRTLMRLIYGSSLYLLANLSVQDAVISAALLNAHAIKHETIDTSTNYRACENAAKSDT